MGTALKAGHTPYSLAVKYEYENKRQISNHPLAACGPHYTEKGGERQLLLSPLASVTYFFPTRSWPSAAEILCG
jgi:hypothetical protein